MNPVTLGLIKFIKSIWPVLVYIFIGLMGKYMFTFASNSLGEIQGIKCPLCSSSKYVEKVLTTRSSTNNNVTYRNFCRNCLVEFDDKGVLYPPIY